MRTLPIALLALAVTLPHAAAQPPDARLTELATSARAGIVQMTGRVLLDLGGRRVPKRFVLRFPEDRQRWSGALVIGAHGGSGGNNFDPAGRVIGTDETALDDVIGQHAAGAAHAYASVDREGAMSAPEGLALTRQFTGIVGAELAARLGREPARRYLVGLSMGGGIARAAAEDPTTPYDGVLIIAGAGADPAARAARQRRIAATWPGVDPSRHPGLPDDDDRVVAFAEAIGTPVAARRLWPYTATAAVAAASRPATAEASSTAEVHVPTIEVAGTWDDFVVPELRLYRERVSPAGRHRLYEVEGVWHMSGDDDGVQSFMYLATRMKLAPDVARAMQEGASYIPTVHQAFDALVAWVERERPAPPSRTLRPGERLR